MNSEILDLVFDKVDISDTGVDVEALARIVSAARKLFDEAARFRVTQERGSLASLATLPHMINIALRTAPVEGSLRLRLDVTLALAALTIAADTSQILGFSVKDGIEAVRAVRLEEKTDDEISARFIKESSARSAASSLLQAAAASGCTYVALERGNDRLVLHGQASAQNALIASQPFAPFDENFKLAEVAGGGQPITVFYHGKPYPAFLIDTSGQPVTSLPPQPIRNHRSAPLVVVWSSTRDIKNGTRYSVRSEVIDPRTITHAEDIPESYIRAGAVFLVTAASPIEFE